MTKGRLEAFSDGVIAIIITIMVLELPTPHGPDWTALRGVVRELLAYLLSFIFIAIYWNNHHHMLHATSRINGRILWANQHLLFWLSLIPFATRWMGDGRLASPPTAAYGTVMLMAAIAYTILTKAIVAHEGPESKLALAVGRDRKGKASLIAYVAAVPLAFVNPWIAMAIYATVALVWLAPDRRIEAVLDR